MSDRIELMLWKINYKLDILLEQSQPGLKEQVRQDIVKIIFDIKDKPDDKQS